MMRNQRNHLLLRETTASSEMQTTTSRKKMIHTKLVILNKIGWRGGIVKCCEMKSFRIPNGRQMRYDTGHVKIQSIHMLMDVMWCEEKFHFYALPQSCTLTSAEVFRPIFPKWRGLSRRLIWRWHLHVDNWRIKVIHPSKAVHTDRLLHLHMGMCAGDPNAEYTVNLRPRHNVALVALLAFFIVFYHYILHSIKKCLQNAQSSIDVWQFHQTPIRNALNDCTQINSNPVFWLSAWEWG